MQLTHAPPLLGALKSGQHVKSGIDFLCHFEDGWITRTVTMAPNLRTIRLSEKKYNFPPDLFKGATRNQRTTALSASIVHLQTYGLNMKFHTFFLVNILL